MQPLPCTPGRGRRLPVALAHREGHGRRSRAPLKTRGVFMRHIGAPARGRSPAERRGGGANIRREEGGGGGWNTKFCVPKMAQSDLPNGKLRFLPRWSRWSWGMGGGWHDAGLCCCLQRAAPIGLSPLTLALPLNPPKGCSRRQEGEGGGVWNPKVCATQMAQINASFCKFRLFPR